MQFKEKKRSLFLAILLVEKPRWTKCCRLITSPIDYFVMNFDSISNLLADSDAEADTWDPRPRAAVVLLVGDPLYAVTGLVS